MEYIKPVFDFMIRIDKHLHEIIPNYGLWTYLILFFIVLCETGRVVTPFLPGDSLLSAAGTSVARGSLDITGLFLLLSVSAILGDTIDYVDRQLCWAIGNLPVVQRNFSLVIMAIIIISVIPGMVEFIHQRRSVR